MNEELEYVLETIKFKTSIYRDKHKRNLTFNDDDYYSNILNEYITNLQQENARLKDKIEKIEEWLKYKAEALDTFDIPKRKETGAFWFTTRGEIDGLLELLKEN